MKGVELSRRARERLDEIYAYGVRIWGEAQAEVYLRALFDGFDAIARGEVAGRPIPAEFGIDGWYRRFDQRYVYWKRLGHGATGIVTVLHERMHRLDRFREDAAP